MRPALFRLHDRHLSTTRMCSCQRSISPSVTWGPTQCSVAGTTFWGMQSMVARRTNMPLSSVSNWVLSSPTAFFNCAQWSLALCAYNYSTIGGSCTTAEIIACFSKKGLFWLKIKIFIWVGQIQFAVLMSYRLYWYDNMNRILACNRGWPRDRASIS